MLDKAIYKQALIFAQSHISVDHFETLIESCMIYFRAYCKFVPLLF